MDSTQTQQQPPVSPPRPRLERLRSERAVAGVASGLARYLGVDVAWIRIGFVVLALFGGSGVLLYLIGWLAIPQEGEDDSIVVDRAGDLQSAGSWIGIALIVIVLLLVAILAFIAATWRADRLAAWLFVPYAAWVSFATLLNGSILALN